MWPFDNKKKEKEFIQSISKSAPLTSDLPFLLQSPYQLLFACDDLMTSHKGNDLIRNHSQRVGRGFSKCKFDFRIHSETGMGIPLTGSKKSAYEPLRIKGEILKVNSEHFKTLDFAYGNDIAYHRVRTSVLVPERMFRTFNIGEEAIVKDLPNGRILTLDTKRNYISEPMVHPVSAWMYVASKKYWNDHLDGGYEYPRADIHEPKEPLPWLPRYFKYPNINRKE